MEKSRGQKSRATVPLISPDRDKNTISDLKSWGPLKISIPEAIYHNTEAYPYMSKNGIKISLDCPFKSVPILFSLSCVIK
jgi:hypothetical protein